MNHITVNKDISSGAPILLGRRLTMFNIVSKIYYEKDLDTALSDYEISLNEAIEAVQYCSTLSCQNDSRIIKFCSGCILRTIQDKWNIVSNDFKTLAINNIDFSVSVSKDGERFFLGPVNEIDDSSFGKLGWLLAESNLKKYLSLRG